MSHTVNTRSDGTLVAYKHKYFRTNLARIRYLTDSDFHHSNGSPEISNWGWVRYWSISCLTFCCGESCCTAWSVKQWLSTLLNPLSFLLGGGRAALDELMGLLVAKVAADEWQVVMLVSNSLSICISISFRILALSLTWVSFNRGSKNDASSSSCPMSPSPKYLSSRSTLIRSLISLVISVSPSTSLGSLMIWFSIGLTADMVTQLSPERASVITLTGFKATVMDSKMSQSCHEGIKWEELRSSHKTTLMASICSISQSTISYTDPHRVTTSNLSLWMRRFFCSWAATRSRRFFQLLEKVATTPLQILKAHCILVSFKPFPTAKLRLWPKQLNPSSLRAHKLV